MNLHIRNYVEGPTARLPLNQDHHLMGHIDHKNREQSVANMRTDISGVIANNAVESIASQLRIALPSLTTIRRQGLRVAAIIAIFKAIIEDGAPVVAFVKDLFSATVA